MTTTGMCYISPSLRYFSHIGVVALPSQLVGRATCFVASTSND